MITTLQIATVVIFAVVWHGAKAILLYDLARRLYTTLEQTCHQVKQRRRETLLNEQVELLMLADYQQLRQKVKELELETSDRKKLTLATALAVHQAKAA